MTEAIYTLDNVTKRYGPREVLRIASFQVSRGEVLGIIGPSGAGKSTLLRLLNFLEEPTTGTIGYEGYKVNGSGPPPLDVQRQVTTVFQRPVLFSGNVSDNVAFGLRLRSMHDTRERVDSALKQVGLQDFARAPARSLSGGEMQRVALARAMVIEPRVLLLDEPTANLDPGNVAIIEQIVTGLNRDAGTTIVLVTHNGFQAKRLAHRVALMLDGRIVEIGPNAAIFESPRDPRTAAFVRGEMVY